VKILVNGAWRDTAARDLAAALEELGYGGSTVATALNGEFVPASLRSDAPLSDGDRLEILAPMQGG
jgi:sulfur carrier protein